MSHAEAWVMPYCMNLPPENLEKGMKPDSPWGAIKFHPG
jgi:hypothetical protein